MLAYVLRRLLEFIPTLFVILLLTFLLCRFAPGSPFASERDRSSEVIAQLDAKYGFDKPLPTQFLMYLTNLAHGDLGLSTKYQQRTVNEIIGEGLPVTLTVASVGLVWALLLGITAGIIGAVRQNTLWDYGSMAAAMIGISVPTFVLGPILVLLFSLTWHILPPAGWGNWTHVILPAVTLGTVRAGYIARLTRGGMLEIVRSDFVRTARSKGLSERLVIWRHMLKGGLLPVISYLGPAIAFMMVGSVVIEKIFNLPGIGPYFVDAAINRDLFLVMGVVLLEAVLLLSMNLVVDIAYAFLDPRIRYE